MGLLFSTFPDGRSGAALLLLRVTVCLEAAVAGAALFAQIRGATAFLIAAPLFVCALCLLIGWMTPAASLLLGLEFIALAVFWPAAPSDSSGVYRLVLVQAGLVGLSLLLSGPGAFSLDACFFGRREIMIPPASRSSRLGQ